MKNQEVTHTFSKFFSIAGLFVTESLSLMIPWLILMFAVIMCDLCFGVRKSYLMGETVRFSRAFRNTMAKIVTYFSFVVMAVMLQVATKSLHDIDKWSILFICFLEICSIVSNILKPKGYEIDVFAAVSVLFKRVFSIDRKDTERVIKKKEKNDV